MLDKYPSVIALGYSEAAMYLRGSDGARVAAIISIHGAQEFGVEADVPSRLDLTFDDVEAPDERDMIAKYRVREYLRREADNGRKLLAPTIEDAQVIVQFAESIRSVEGTVLCHCGGGVSRSPAAAILCLATWMRPGEEKRIVEHVQKIRPCAVPHAGLIRFGDNILARRGALLAAIR